MRRRSLDFSFAGIIRIRYGHDASDAPTVGDCESPSQPGTTELP